MHVIGDLSAADIRVLGEHALRAKHGILEFGVGGSTQVLANFSAPLVPFVAVDTSRDWLLRAKSLLRRLQIRRQLPVEMQYWSGVPDAPLATTLKRGWDFVFVDGRRELRKTFADCAWPHLQAGGTLLWHDCRRDLDFAEIVAFVREHGPEVESLHLSVGESNLAAIRKRPYLLLEDWHMGKRDWELGVGQPPDELPWPFA